MRHELKRTTVYFLRLISLYEANVYRMPRNTVTRIPIRACYARTAEIEVSSLGVDNQNTILK